MESYTKGWGWGVWQHRANFGRKALKTKKIQAAKRLVRLFLFDVYADEARTCSGRQPGPKLAEPGQTGPIQVIVHRMRIGYKLFSMHDKMHDKVRFPLTYRA